MVKLYNQATGAVYYIEQEDLERCYDRWEVLEGSNKGRALYLPKPEVPKDATS